MKKWVKASLIIAPLAMGSSVYALASERSTSQATVSIQEVQPAQESSAPAVEQPNIQNPFIVNKDAILKEIAALDAAQQTQSTTLSIEQIRKLHIEAKTDRGELKLEYHLEGNGTPQLNGEVGDVKVHLSGDKAKELLNSLLTRWELFDVLQKVLADPNVKLDAKVLKVLDDFELETIDGKKVKLDDEKVKAQAVQKPVPTSVQKPVQTAVKVGQDDDDDDDQGEDKEKHEKEKHDNGKHKGQEKHQEKHGEKD